MALKKIGSRISSEDTIQGEITAPKSDKTTKVFEKQSAFVFLYALKLQLKDILKEDEAIRGFSLSFKYDNKYFAEWVEAILEKDENKKIEMVKNVIGDTMLGILLTMATK